MHDLICSTFVKFMCTNLAALQWDWSYPPDYCCSLVLYGVECGGFIMSLENDEKQWKAPTWKHIHNPHAGFKSLLQKCVILCVYSSEGNLTWIYLHKRWRVDEHDWNMHSRTVVLMVVVSTSSYWSLVFMINWNLVTCVC